MTGDLIIEEIQEREYCELKTSKVGLPISFRVTSLIAVFRVQSMYATNAAS